MRRGARTGGVEEAPGLCRDTPPTAGGARHPTKGRCPLDPRQGQWPLEPLTGSFSEEGQLGPCQGYYVACSTISVDIIHCKARSVPITSAVRLGGEQINLIPARQ